MAVRKINNRGKNSRDLQEKWDNSICVGTEQSQRERRSEVRLLGMNGHGRRYLNKRGIEHLGLRHKPDEARKQLTR
jgi:hypothetical protein